MQPSDYAKHHSPVTPTNGEKAERQEEAEAPELADHEEQEQMIVCSRMWYVRQ